MIHLNRSVSILLCSTLVVARAAAEEHKKREGCPNILVLIADDISRDDFGCYGHPLVKTPHIDALAAEGVRFTNMFLTASSSSPSRASILTGRYPHNTGACELHSPIGEEQVTIAGLLKKNGYYTAQAGKWHFGTSSSKPAGPVLADFDRTGGSALDGGGTSGAERWVEYLRERPADKPFFMWFAAHDAHRNWDNDQTFERYDPEMITVPDYLVDDSVTREDLACYYYEISRFDYFVGQVISELKRQGIYDSTFIVVMADNGRPFPRAKTRLLTDGIQTPFIIRYPPAMRGGGGKICNSLVSSIDLAPTLADIAGLIQSRTFQGRSFKPLLKHTDREFRTYAFAEHNWHDFEAYERMICTDSYLLIWNARPNLNAEGASDIMKSGAGHSLLNAYARNRLNKLQHDIFITPRPEIELYDYSNDPGQLYNIATEKPEITKKLKALLERWQTQTGDSVPDHLTPDWYSRETLEKLSVFRQRGEMPGNSMSAEMNNNAGPF